jgi:NADPH:quinone reductase-like Zn-dependent oxidoreductase
MEHSKNSFEEMNKAFNKFQLRPVIDQVYAFGEALSAFRHLERGAFGKVVINVASRQETDTFSTGSQ